MKKAFSLAELLIVLSIISMIMGTMKVHVHHRKIQADAKNIVENFYVYHSTITMYYLRNGGVFPGNNWDFLENIDKLKPYCPKGLKSSGGVNTKEYKDIFIYKDGNKFAIIIALYKGKTTELRDEIVKQLKEYAVPSQVDTTSASQQVWYVWFYLKNGDNIYI